MYEELIKMLRTCSERDSCIGWHEACPYLGTGVCDNKAEKAADAIEELTGFAQEAERDRDEYRERLERTNELLLNRWIPVTERLPKAGSDILAYYDVGEEARIISANYDKGIWYDCHMNRTTDHITHWMPLPKPPKEET